MKKRIFPSSVLLSLSVLVLFAVGCGPSEEEIATQTAAAWTATPTITPIPSATPTPLPPTVTPTPPPPETIIENAIAVWEQVKSYHFEISAQIDTILSGLMISTILEYSGDFQAPDRYQGTQHTEFFGIASDSEFVNIGKTSYTTNVETGEWQKDVESLFPFGPEDLIGLQPADLENAVLIGVEKLDGVLVYHLAGSLPSEKFAELFGVAEIELPMEYWISVEDGYIVQVALEIELPEGSGDLESLSVTAIVTFSEFGKEVNIEAPDLP